MDIKRLLIGLSIIAIALVFIKITIKASCPYNEKPREPFIISSIETEATRPPRIQSVVESTREAMLAPELESDPETETPPLRVETESEDESIFYDVPFDLDTQKEIIEICSEYDIPYELVLGVMWVESGFNADAIGDGGNSFGLMQIQPRWWIHTMAREGINDLLDPLQNIRCGCAILRELKDKYGTEYRALQAYNTGNPDSNSGYADKVYLFIVELMLYGG